MALLGIMRCSIAASEQRQALWDQCRQAPEAGVRLRQLEHGYPNSQRRGHPFAWLPDEYIF